MSEELESMVKMLSDSPEDQRKSMITERFKMIASQPDEQRVGTVGGLVLAISKLETRKRKEFVRTRTNAVAELPAETRKTIQTSRVRAGASIPEDINMKDMALTLEAASLWPPEKRSMFKQNLGAAFAEVGQPMPDFDSITQTIPSGGEEEKKSRWKFW
jgi:hypothetical protein